MQVWVVYQGMLREIAGREREQVQLPEGARLGELYRELQDRMPKLAGFQRSIALAVNYEYSQGDTELHPGDEVALIPPVSGGAPDEHPVENALLQSEHASLVRERIDVAAVSRLVHAPEDGAVVIFDGVVRNHTRGRRTYYLEYSAYEEMALREMEKLAQKALTDFQVREVRIVHRLGRLEIGETSVCVAVGSAHRGAAFDAGRWLIDTLKKTVPIWKKEFFQDGAVWADGDPFPPEIAIIGGSASK